MHNGWINEKYTFRFENISFRFTIVEHFVLRIIHIEELQEKLDNTKSYVEDVQAALEDGSFSDAYDAASDAESEAEYEDY